jgi:hypothetical protein
MRLIQSKVIYKYSSENNLPGTFLRLGYNSKRRGVFSDKIEFEAVGKGLEKEIIN